MAKNPAKPRTPVPAGSIETQVVLMRRLSSERFEVVTGTLVGELRDVKVLEKNVSLAVGRGTARKHLAQLHDRQSLAFGLVDA